MDQFKIQSPFH